MNLNKHGYQSALNDFTSIRSRAFMQEVLACIMRKSQWTSFFTRMSQNMKLNARAEQDRYDIMLKAIFSCVGRYKTLIENDGGESRDDPSGRTYSSLQG